MRLIGTILVTILVIPFLITTEGCNRHTDLLVRPEKIVSLRQVVYNQNTYKELAAKWADYYRVFPSEDAYTNWVYAERYASNKQFHDMALDLPKPDYTMPQIVNRNELSWWKLAAVLVIGFIVGYSVSVMSRPAEVKIIPQYKQYTNMSAGNFTFMECVVDGI